jgi:S1-C subfamily serine protease
MRMRKMLQTRRSIIQPLWMVWLGVILLVVSIGQAQAQVTSNVLRRVLMIRHTASNSFGTAFTLEVEGRQYVITPKHVVAGLKPEDTLEINQHEQWSSVKVKVLHCDDPIDIAVLIPPVQLTVSYPLEPNTDKVLYGQDAYFVGFPYGLFTGGKKVNGLYPIAFIKKGTFSATGREGIATVIFLDGHNNPGFSGGPIVYRDLNQNGTVFYLAGVISGFLPELIPTVVPEVVKPGQDISQEEPWRIRKLNDGRIFKLKDSELTSCSRNTNH